MFSNTVIYQNIFINKITKKKQMKNTPLSLSQDLKHNSSSQDNQFFIEPIKQQLYSFNTQNLNAINHIQQLKSFRASDSGWRPTLSSKKIMDDPKFILSMERKKARIISAIRDKQDDNKFCEKSIGSMTGSKLKSYEVYRYQHRNIARSSTNKVEISQIAANNQKKLEEVNLKKKKNPYMSFSLNFIRNQKKEKTSRQSGKNLSVKQKSIAREKGSNAVYQFENLIHTECLLDKPRKKNSWLTQRNIDQKISKRPLTSGSCYASKTRRPSVNIKNNESKFRAYSVMN